jgi:hypothetical protein
MFVVKSAGMISSDEDDAGGEVLRLELLVSHAATRKQKLKTDAARRCPGDMVPPQGET